MTLRRAVEPVEAALPRPRLGKPYGVATAPTAPTASTTTAKHPNTNTDLQAVTNVPSLDCHLSARLLNLYVQPIVLGWHKERADYLAGLGIYAPVGRYEADGDNNIGLGMWSYEAFGGAMFYLNQAKTWNLAVVAFYETHSSKKGSSQKVGDIVTLEGGLGRSFAEGAINVGLAYFGQWQVTDDDLGLEINLPDDSPFDLPDLHRHQILGARPEVTLPLATKKKFYGSVTLRHYWDFAVESNAESRTFIFNLTVPVPFISLTEE